MSRDCDRLLIDQVQNFVSEEDGVAVVLAHDVGSHSPTQVSEEALLVDCVLVGQGYHVFVRNCRHWVSVGVGVLRLLVGHKMDVCAHLDAFQKFKF